MTTITRKTLAALATATLACSFGVLAFTPSNAHAVQPSDTPLNAQAADSSLTTQPADPALLTQATNLPLSAQAVAKKSVYVRSALNDKKYTYSKYGFLTKIAGSNFHWDIKYKGAKIAEIAHSLDRYGHTTPDITYTFQYDSKNRVKAMTVVSEGMPTDLYNNTETYTYNSKNQATKRITTYASGAPSETTRYFYNAKGLVKKIVSPSTTEVLKYDSKGNMTFWSRKSTSGSTVYNNVYKFKNAYRSGRLIKVTQTDGHGDYVQQIKYAKKSIPKKYAATVNAQQQALRVFIPGMFLSQIS